MNHQMLAAAWVLDWAAGIIGISNSLFTGVVCWWVVPLRMLRWPIASAGSVSGGAAVWLAVQWILGDDGRGGSEPVPWALVAAWLGWIGTLMAALALQSTRGRLKLASARPWYSFVATPSEPGRGPSRGSRRLRGAPGLA
jgi:hypothetical protein